ncbi:MAG: FxLYD domain-containing protein [Bryobacteraceae bacterium]|jgi:hypothetical protein
MKLTTPTSLICAFAAIAAAQSTETGDQRPARSEARPYANIVTVATQIAAEKKSVPVAVLVVALAAILGAGFFLYLDRAAQRPPPPPPPLTAEAKAYVHSLQLMDVDMQKHESYMKQAVVEITGKIGNNGSRGLRVVEINCVFYDPYGQLVLRRRVPIVGQKMGGLAPGEIKNFRLAFDDIPDSWNQALPQLVIAQIVFG